MVNKQRAAGLSDYCVEEFRMVRKKPSPSNVIEPTKEDFFAISEHLKPVFKTTCPAPTRPIRDIMIRAQDEITFECLNSWNGRMDTAVALPRHKPLRAKVLACIDSPFKRLYFAPLPISGAKFADL
ncbi:hypothetical protein PoB_006633900 [Plakobranchus ocellatus]|uniref:Uncharacterized protein n=1 Tax=Plakobranchus ocellatus TaxID=259542 RepID=A0AAV4D6K7_9GAST|nr:hypothetical protein PoB_006633900 [Plakobranchus ocellatus]